MDRILDPIFEAIEKHRLADAAFDDSLTRNANVSVKDTREDQERTALIALLRTKPETLAGCLAALRCVADWADHNDAGLFHGWNDPHRSAAVAFLPMIADAIETATGRR